MAIRKPTQAEIENRFWSKVDKTNDCWIWKGTLNNNGYGFFSYNGRNISSHRYSYILHYREIPESQPLVCHRCDNRLCVNPHHLFAGTHKENSQDSVRKGRWGDRTRLGEDNPAAKLTEKQVLEIRELAGKVYQKDLAKRFGVTIHLIRKIVYRHVWTHI